MIDLGEELADYGEEEPRWGPIAMHPAGGYVVRLSDLQELGFNRVPPPGFGWPGRVDDGS